MLRRPPCGNDREAHGPHQFTYPVPVPLTDGELAALGLREPLPEPAGQCGGWTQTEADVAGMIAGVLATMAAHELAWQPQSGEVSPPPLRLELSPAAHAALLRTLTPGLADRDEVLGGRGGLAALFGTPIVVTGDLPPGRWRLIVPGPVLTSGTVTT